MPPSLPQADNASATAAAAAAAGNSKRERDASSVDEAEVARALKSLKESPEKSKGKAGSKKGGPEEQLPLRGAPYYFYTDHSLDADEDPFTPVTPPNVVPAFPIKMHAILSMPELSDVIGWDTHGRSFRILKPKRFEKDVLPLYFEHSKFSSFTRQV
jgi:hypothetical protein